VEPVETTTILFERVGPVTLMGASLGPVTL